MQMRDLLERWDIRRGAEAEWIPWGAGEDAKAKILGQADGYTLTLIQAEVGYTGSYHEHTYAEFFFLVDGEIRNQGQVMKTGDGYAASAGSTHSDFEVLSPSTYLIVWRI
jgi:hypothetical protein